MLFVCQIADFIGYYGKPFSGGACAGGFYGGVQGENIGLERNIFNDLHDFADLTGAAADILHCMRHLLHFFLAHIIFTLTPSAALLACRALSAF